MISTLIKILALVLFIALGWVVAYRCDLRPPGFPSVHQEISVLWFRYKFDWVAPDSPYAQGFKNGQRSQASADRNLCQSAVASVHAQNAGAEAMEDAALAKARASLRAAQEMRARRGAADVRVAQVMGFHGYGSNCEQAEEIARRYAQ